MVTLIERDVREIGVSSRLIKSPAGLEATSLDLPSQVQERLRV